MKLNIKSKAYIVRLLKLKRNRLHRDKQNYQKKHDLFGVNSCNEEITIINIALEELRT